MHSSFLEAILCGASIAASAFGQRPVYALVSSDSYIFMVASGGQEFDRVGDRDFCDVRLDELELLYC